MTTLKAHIPFSNVRDNLGGRLAMVYDATVQGGTVGTVYLDAQLPANAVIVGAYVDVLTDPTSAGSATVAIGLDSTTDVLAATAIASVTGVVVAKEQSAAFKLGAEAKKIGVTIATADLTAGKMAIVIDYIGSFDEIESY